MFNANQVEDFLRKQPLMANSPVVINFRTDQTKGFAFGVCSGVLGTNNLALAFYPRDIPVGGHKSLLEWFGQFFRFVDTKEQKLLGTMFVINVHKNDLTKMNISNHRELWIVHHPINCSDSDGLAEMLPEPLYKIFYEHRVERSKFQIRLDLLEAGFDRVGELSKVLLSLGDLNDETLLRVKEIAKVVESVKGSGDSSSIKVGEKEKSKK